MRKSIHSESEIAKNAWEMESGVPADGWIRSATGSASRSERCISGAKSIAGLDVGEGAAEAPERGGGRELQG